MINRLFNKIVSVYRMSDNGDGTMSYNKITDIKCALFPKDSDKTSMDTGVYGKEYVMYVDKNEDIREGDRIDDSYTVASGGVTVHEQGRMSFKKVMLTLS